jgi:hypothetical protein
VAGVHVRDADVVVNVTSSFRSDNFLSILTHNVLHHQHNDDITSVQLIITTG